MARTAGSTNKPQFRMVTLGKLAEIFNNNMERQIPVSDKFIGGFLEFEGVVGTEAEESLVENTTTVKDSEDISVKWHEAGEDE